MSWRSYYWKVYLEAEAFKAQGCRNCGAQKGALEFAHIKPTQLKGRGRGSHRRRLDVLKHKDCYTVLCKRCHWKFDRGMTDIQAISLSSPRLFV